MLYSGKIPIASVEKNDWYTGMDFYFSLNELNIDDNMLSYETRSTSFIQYLNQNPFQGSNSVTYYENEVDEDVDVFCWIGFQLS